MGKKLGGRRKQNDDDDMKMIKTCDSSYASPWSDLTHDVLILVMMKLAGLIDFISFSGVCMSWRSLAVPNRKKFMVTRPPMLMWVFPRPTEKESSCCLEDFEGRRFKTLLPHSGARWSLLGLTCGYMIWLGKETNDFWLVNPITRHQLHFSAVPWFENIGTVKAILVYSPSIPGRVLVAINTYQNEICFSIEGKGVWNHVSTTSRICDLHAFKGKIYTLNCDGLLYEMTLNPKPKLSMLKFKYLGQQKTNGEFVSLGENLYVIEIDIFHHNPPVLYQVNFGGRKGVTPEEKSIGEYAIFLSNWKRGVAIKPESWTVDPRSIYKTYDFFRNSLDETQKGRFFNAINGWYFPHLC